jgi:hypothetical protein
MPKISRILLIAAMPLLSSWGTIAHSESTLAFYRVDGHHDPAQGRIDLATCERLAKQLLIVSPQASNEQLNSVMAQRGYELRPREGDPIR